MHRLIRYVSSLVCLHQWKEDEFPIEIQNPINGKVIGRDTMVHRACTRCPARHNYSKVGRVSILGRAVGVMIR